MAVDPAKVCLFIPAGLKKFKLDLFERIGAHIEKAGGRVVRHNAELLAALPAEIIPIVGCQPETAPLVAQWRRTGRTFITWDRGYLRRVFAAALPRAPSIEQSYYRWHINSYQLSKVWDAPVDRWLALKLQDQVKPWQKAGRHIVVAAPSRTYAKVHNIRDWIADTIDALARVTGRQLVIRDKEHVRSRPLQADLEGAHALVTHGSITAVESIVLGCPVFVSPDSAAALVGQTDLSRIEKPIYPDRTQWLHSLAASQFNEAELTDGSLWRLIG